MRLIAAREQPRPSVALWSLGAGTTLSAPPWRGTNCRTAVLVVAACQSAMSPDPRRKVCPRRKRAGAWSGFGSLVVAVRENGPTRHRGSARPPDWGSLPGNRCLLAHQRVMPEAERRFRVVARPPCPSAGHATATRSSNDAPKRSRAARSSRGHYWNPRAPRTGAWQRQVPLEVVARTADWPIPTRALMRAFGPPHPAGHMAQIARRLGETAKRCRDGEGAHVEGGRVAWRPRWNARRRTCALPPSLLVGLTRIPAGSPSARPLLPAPYPSRYATDHHGHSR